jgi:hypothetical protein
MSSIPHIDFDQFPAQGYKANGKAYEDAAHRPQWPDPPTAEAFHGLAGDYVRLVEPASEVDPTALLLQILVATGNLIGHAPHFVVEDTPHHVNLNAVLVGLSSKSRKGTSWQRVKKFLSETDGGVWVANCISSGLSSGEGLIEAVRDASGDPESDKFDPGVDDKRLLIQQGEFCSVLRQMERDGNILSMVLRDAWDCVPLRTMTRKNNKLRATNTHISVIGHITRDELRAALAETDKANGFANRILWVCTRRSKELPEEIEIERGEWLRLVSRMASVREFASNRASRMHRDDEAKKIWRDAYHDLSEPKTGMLGAITSRAEAQVLRLSLLYAVLDESLAIRSEHLLAALAFWKHCEASARYIFGDALGDPVADSILAAISESEDGLTRTEISNLLGRNKSAGRIAAALAVLEERGLISHRTQKTEGRPVELWFATGRNKRN